MASRTVKLEANISIGTKARVAGAILAVAALVLVSHSVGYNSGFANGNAKGLEDGNKAGFERGDKAGFENGYWLGREDGCLWIINESGKDFVTGIGNPFTTWYYLMDLGVTYLERDNCSTEGHGDAPYKESPYTSPATGTN
jgi:hypothetical protein